MKKQDLIDELLKETSLEARIKATIETYFIALYGGSILVPLDENGNELPEVVVKNNKYLNKAQPLIKHVIDDIKKWKQDGCPE